MLCKNVFQSIFRYSRKASVLIFLTAVLLTACGQGKDAGQTASDIDGSTSAITREGTSNGEAFTDSNRGAEEDLTDDAATDNDGIVSGVDETAQTDDLKQRFGETCIAEQTFEAELSEYDGKVWFVPYAPSEEEDFHIQIIQGEEVLGNISAYVPEELAGEKFVSLDAVAFFDVNYDNETDIMLIETYGNSSFTAVYYGESYTYLDGDASVFFYAEERLSNNLTRSVETLTIPVIRDFLGNGKKNGEFADYREAYLAVGKLKDMESDGKIEYELVYFDEDDIPELVADYPGYFMSLYTYHEGKIYTLMNEWGYGVMGNSGYEYCPGKNSLRNYNADYAGLILYTTYCSISAEYTMDTVVSIKTVNFDDANGNGMPDEDEEETFSYYSVDYIDDVEITPEEYDSYSVGEYEWLGSGENSMSLEELAEALN